MTRAHLAALIGLNAPLFAWALLSCIIADPAPQLISPPPPSPRILRDQVQPPASAILGAFPDTFTVPVLVGSADQTFVAHLYIDFNEDGLGGGFAEQKTSGPQTTPDSSNVRYIALTNSQGAPVDLSRCHRIEALVATSFVGRDGFDGHTPLDPYADSVVWWYSPNGDLRGCPTYDAGLYADGALPDVQDGGGD
jgi:hypothetical protein